MVSCLLIVISLAGARGGNTHTRKGINLSAFSNLCKQHSTSSFGFLAKVFFFPQLIVTNGFHLPPPA